MSGAARIADFEGRQVGPEDSGYDEARKVYNAMIDRRPALVASRPASRTWSGRSTSPARAACCSPCAAAATTAPASAPATTALVLDLSGLKRIEVDPAARTARVGGGCTWGEVDAATHEHGLATPSGIISTTGVGGLTLGGGIGHLSRKCGLTIDNLLEAEVVLASGSRVRAAPTRTPTCSGRSAAAAATSASSSPSSSACTRWAPSSAARPSGTSSRAPRC